MKKTLKQIPMIVIFCILFCNYSLAYSEKINVQIESKDSFKVGDVISFNYTLLSDEGIELVYVPGINCPNAQIGLIFERTIKLEENKPFSERFDERVVDEYLEPQTCTAYVQVLSPIQKTVSKEFEIITNPSFSFDIKLDKKIFLLNEDININYNSEIESPLMTATLTYPDKTTNQINLPTLIKAEQIGTYTLETTASKEGYKTITKKEQFAVIEKNAEIGSFTGEGRQKLLDNKWIDTKVLFYVIVGVVILVVVLVVFFIIKKKRANQTSNPKLS